MSELSQFALGRLPAPDERDKNFMLRSIIPPTTRTSRYWNHGRWWGNQGTLPHCVGFSFAQWIQAGPVTHTGVQPIIDPSVIYHEAQGVDEFPGTNYDGTSVRAGAKVLQNRGVISSYHWGSTLDELVYTVLTLGPVVIGINWYEQMFNPNANGLIKIGGDIAGGHAIVVDGGNTKTKLLRMPQSWGRQWGDNGYCYISFEDMERLIDEEGEVCLGVENKIFTN